MAVVATQAPMRAAYDPVWTPLQFSFPVAQKFTGNKRPAPLDLSATLRPRRSRSSPAVSHFSVDQLRTKKEDGVPTGIITEQIIEEPPTSPLPPQKSSNMGEIVVGLGIPATLRSNGSKNDLSDPLGSARSTATTMSNQSEATSIFTVSTVSSATSASSTKSRRNVDLATVAAMEEILDIAKMSPHYIPNIRSAVPSPGHAPLTSPSNLSVRSAKSNASTVGRGPLSGNSSKTVVGLPSSPKPKRGALSPNSCSTAPTSPCLSFASDSTRQTNLRSPATTIDSSLPSPTPSTSSSLAPPSISDSQPSPALSNQTGPLGGRTPPPPPYSRSPKAAQSRSQKSSFSYANSTHLPKGMYAHSNASNASTSTHHSSEWEAVEALLQQVRLQQKQLEELQRSYEHQPAATDIVTTNILAPSRHSGSVADGDSGVMNFEFGFDRRDPLEQQRQEMNAWSPKQKRARALTSSAAGPASPIAYIPVPGSPMSPLHVPAVHQVSSATPYGGPERETGGIGASFEKLWKGGRRLASRSRTPGGVRSSSMAAHGHGHGHERTLSYEVVR